MAYKIEWTDDALEDMHNVIYYPVTQWSQQVAEKFEAVTLSRLNTLTAEPFLGIVSSANTEVRSIVLTRHNKLYYRVKGQVIVILNSSIHAKILLKTSLKAAPKKYLQNQTFSLIFAWQW
jgi:plasmid stabilization system protein ParE